MRRRLQWLFLVMSFVVGLAIVIEAQLWTSGSSSLTTSGTVSITNAGASALNVTGTANIGTLNVSTFGAHNVSSSGTGGNGFIVTNTLSGTTNFSYLRATAGTTIGQLSSYSQGYSTGSYDVTAGVALAATGAGGLSLVTTDPAGDIRFYTTSTQAGIVNQAGVLTWNNNVDVDGTLVVDNNVTLGDSAGDVHTVNGRINSASAQPGFLAYNSADDINQVGTVTVDFDTESYDNTASFAADTFTAPVTGQYMLCAWVEVSDADDPLTLQISTTGGNFRIGFINGIGLTAFNLGGCVIVPMSASDNALVQVVVTGTDIDIAGGSSPRKTYFSGRLMP